MTRDERDWPPYARHLPVVCSREPKHHSRVTKIAVFFRSAEGEWGSTWAPVRDRYKIGCSLCGLTVEARSGRMHAALDSYVAARPGAPPSVELAALDAIVRPREP